ncbi:hypothetical protein [Ramlibacter albus]|nr:hypothetical protein [Ramlibacter albus]
MTPMMMRFMVLAAALAMASMQMKARAEVASEATAAHPTLSCRA